MTDNQPMFTQPLPRATLRRVGRIFRPYWRQALLIVLTIIATSSLGVVNPVLSGQIIDRAFPRQDRALLTVLVLALLATDSLYWLIYLAQGFLSATVGQRIMWALGRSGQARQLRFLKRQLSLPVSMMSQWCVRRSSMAVVILASPNTCGQSAKARLVVIRSDVFS